MTEPPKVMSERFVQNQFFVKESSEIPQEQEVRICADKEIIKQLSQYQTARHY